MKVTTYIARFLKAKQIDCIFELQGGMITRIIDEVYREGGIKIISMHHEQAAAFAADAYARVTNKPGVAMATSGPGATNLITGIGSCYFDSVPAIFITGQVNLNEQKGDKPTRQIGFQETDILPIVKPITKAAWAVTSSDQIPQMLEDAFQLSISGRPGPVLIDLPMNIQNMGISVETVSEPAKEAKKSNPKIDHFITRYLAELEHSQKPLILVGRGIRTSGTEDALLRLAEQLGIPVVTSLLALDVIPYNHSNRVGFIGTYGNRWANYALGTTDLLLVLGSRLDLRQTGADVPAFTKGKKIFHVDIDDSELNNRVTACETLHCDLTLFFENVLDKAFTKKNFEAWSSEIGVEYARRKDTDELKGIKGINPNAFMHKLSQYSMKAAAVTTDVGNNQMWTAQSYEVAPGQLFLSSGGIGAMGFSLPAAIGACFASGRKPIVAISGDGGFQINIQELQTIVRNQLPVKIIILNNQSLGMIRQFQDAYFESCYQSTVWGYTAPDFAKVASAYGIDAHTISMEEEITDGLAKLWENPKEPFLLNVALDLNTNVYPKMLFGNPLTKMEPE